MKKSIAIIVGGTGQFGVLLAEKLLKKKKPLLIGLAHSCQKIVRVPNNQHDKKLDIILTESYKLG